MYLNMGKISSLIGKEFDSESAYGDNDQYIKTKIKSNGYNKKKHFQSKKVTKENVSYKCLALVVIDSFIRVNKKYLQTILEDFKYEIKKNKMENLINNDLDSSSSREPDNESHNESDNESEKLSKKPNKKPSKKSDNDKFESD